MKLSGFSTVSFSDTTLISIFLFLAFSEKSSRIGPDFAANVMPHYLNYRKVSIYGGSNEIQRNVIAKAVLGI